MEEELKRLFQDGSNGERRTGWRCANESDLAAYADGALGSGPRASLEKHLADCASCRAQVAFLINSSDWVDPPDVPSPLLAKAKSLVPEKRKPTFGFRWRWATGALAACIVLAFLVVFALRLRSSDAGPQQAVKQNEPKPAAEVNTANPPANPDLLAAASPPPATKSSQPRTEPSAPTVRSAPTDNRSPKLLFPHDGEVIGRGPISVRWEPVAEAVSYDVSIMSTAGDTLVERSTDTTSLTVPADGLLAGTKYFVYVRAHFRDARTSRTSAAFRTGNH